MKKIFLTLSLVLLAALTLAVTAPVAANATLVQRTDGTKLVDIGYDLSDAENDNCTISILISTDSGSSFALTPTPANLSGDIGAGITVGTGKHIVWDIGAESYPIDLSTYRVKVLAEDGTQSMTENFVFFQGGTHQYLSALFFTISSFYIDKYETTQAKYLEVMGSNPSNFSAVVNGPVERVTWYKAIEFCNRRSILEGLTPCYSYSTDGTNPDNWTPGWNTADANNTNVNCDWTANGYRLPTEWEWTYAARGGIPGDSYSYSGSMNLDAVAWFLSNSGSTTHPVGAKAANSLGTYDQTGNVNEWCWDIPGVNYANGNYIDPRGAVSGTTRKTKGGAYNTRNTSCGIIMPTSGVFPTASINSIGFRCVRNVP